jgi:hypothetical protein
MGSKLPGELLGAPDDTPRDPTELARRIEELREAIARDRAALRELAAAARAPEGDGADPRLEAIANRLPIMQSELARLEEAQRERGAAGPIQQP